MMLDILIGLVIGIICMAILAYTVAIVRTREVRKRMREAIEKEFDDDFFNKFKR